MTRSLSSSIIKTAFPNYYKRTKENSRYYEESMKETYTEKPRQNLNQSTHSSSNTFNYVLPDPDNYDLVKNFHTKKRVNSFSLEPQRSNFGKKNRKKENNNDIDLEIKANHRSDFIKQNIKKINGYSRYSMYSPNRSFIRKNKDSRSFTKYLINDLLKPRYNNFEKKSHKEATKLIEKKYEFQDPERFEVNKYQGIFF